jgi:drug/metabolite transporter (DMT)-like permease
MPWQVTTILYVLLASARAIQNRRVGLYDRDVSLYVLISSFTCIFIVGLVVALFNWNEIDHNAAIESLPFLVIGGIMFAGLNVMILKLYRFVPASIMAFTVLLNTLSVVLFATIAGGEVLTVRQILGALVLFTSVAVVGLLTKRKKNSSNKVLLGVGAAILTAFLLGPAILNEKYLIQTIGLSTYVFYGWGLQAFFAFLIAYIFRARNSDKQKITVKMHKNVWLVGALLGLAGFSYVTSIEKSGTVAPIALSGTAVVGMTVFIAYFVLKEKDHLLAKIAGLFLSGVGLVLLFS